MQEKDQRLNKYLALQLGISRREADELIDSSRVLVDGNPAELGMRVSPSSSVSVDGREVEHGTSFAYLLLHKPAGYVCSRRAQGSTPTIYALLPQKYHHLKPVGRLDKDSSGLLLMTNDGDFAHRMTHPKFRKTKLYEVVLDKPLQPLHQQMISDFGVMLPDGKSQFMIEKLGTSPESSSYQTTLTEGRNRQIRRTFAALGYEVTKLHRTNFGNYALGDIKSGEHIMLNISPAA